MLWIQQNIIIHSKCSWTKFIRLVSKWSIRHWNIYRAQKKCYSDRFIWNRKNLFYLSGILSLANLLISKVKRLIKRLDKPRFIRVGRRIDTTSCWLSKMANKSPMLCSIKKVLLDSIKNDFKSNLDSLLKHVTRNISQTLTYKYPIK